MKRKVGIIGGTFNPIHTGHLILAEAAYESFELDEVLFVPTGISNLKDPSIILDKKQRIALTGAAIGENPHFALSTIERRKHVKKARINGLSFFMPKNTFYLFLRYDIIKENVTKVLGDFL